MDDPLKWYQNPLFNRYWHHYRETLGWFQQHKQVLCELEHGVKMSCKRNECVGRQSDSKLWHGGRGGSNESRKRRRSAAEAPLSPCSEEDDLDCERHVAGEELEMEVTEDMIAFFEQSDKHRKELRAARESKRNEEKAKEEGSASSGPGSGTGPMSVGERLSRRTREMKSLYGKSADMINGIESAMQLSCDHFVQMKRPKHWPNIPFKL